jgi:2,5-furandicarboxylate decarboxylase 1
VNDRMQQAAANQSGSKPDMEQFRLRRFVEKLIDAGEVEVVKDPVALADVSPIVEGSRKAVLFRNAGPDKLELVAGVMGSRRRMALSLGVEDARAAQAEFLRRIESKQPLVEVSSSEAPVHQVVLTGDKADLTRLPFHPQHEFDGGVYLTSGIDFSVDPETGVPNVGCRRLSLRGRHECLTNLTGRSHLRAMYIKCAQRGERLPVSFAVGTHPLDFLASSMRTRKDETEFVAALRGEPVPFVKCATNDLLVPADAEVIIEGYLDERGYIEPEGPYGEYMGYYGPVHLDPIFHVTAITMRRDALHQSLLHGSGRVLGLTEAANLSALRMEAEAAKLLRHAGIDVVAICQSLWAGECQDLRVAIRQTAVGQARRAISLLFGAMPVLKQVFVVDEDIDPFSDEQMEWALGTRFQPHRDLMILEEIPGMQMDPSLEGHATGGKAGYDCTWPVGRPWAVQQLSPAAKRFSGEARHRSVEEALKAGPLFFTHLMEALGSRDGREVTLELDALRRAGRLGRDSDGRYHLAESEPGRTAQIGPRGHDPNLL